LDRHATLSTITDWLSARECIIMANIDHVPTVSLPSIIYCNFRAYLQNRYIRYNMYSGRPCENSLQRRRVERRTSIYTKILRKLWLVYGIYTFWGFLNKWWISPFSFAGFFSPFFSSPIFSNQPFIQKNPQNLQ
jgi:hypothetical protein